MSCTNQINVSLSLSFCTEGELCTESKLCQLDLDNSDLGKRNWELGSFL